MSTVRFWTRPSGRFASVDDRFSTYKDDSEVIAHQPRRAGRVRGCACRCARRAMHAATSCARATRGYFDATCCRWAGHRSVRPRKGLVGRPRRCDPHRCGRTELRDQRRRRRRSSAAAACRTTAGASESSIPRQRQGGRSSSPTTSPSQPRARTRAAPNGRPAHTPPPSGVLSVTITGPELATADAYATAAFAMGSHGPAWTARLTRLRGDDDSGR